MKNLKNTLLVASILFLSQCIANAQEQDDKSQAYSIHEDHVKPSMVSEYEKSTKELVANCEKHNVQSTKWITTSTEDNILSKRAFSTLRIFPFSGRIACVFLERPCLNIHHPLLSSCC